MSQPEVYRTAIAQDRAIVSSPPPGAGANGSAEEVLLYSHLPASVQPNGAGGEIPGRAIISLSAPRKKGWRRLMMLGVVAAMVTAAADYGLEYWTVGRFLISTDDAYVKVDKITIASRVSGFVRDVLVSGNEKVVAGQILARIEDLDFEIALAQATTDEASARAVAAKKQAHLESQQAAIDAARSMIDLDEAALDFAGQEDERSSDPARNGQGTMQNAGQAASRVTDATPPLDHKTADLISAAERVELLKAEVDQANAVLARKRAAREQAELNLRDTNIAASVSGIVADRALRAGQYVEAGTQLMSIEPIDAAYVVANFEETQLTTVRRGQPVEIEIDMFPGWIVRGRVESIAPASAQGSSLPSPDNASGNFSRAVQRMAVRIAVDPQSSPIELRPGMSVVPTIDTAAAVPETSGGACHVKSKPFNPAFRASDIASHI